MRLLALITLGLTQHTTKGRVGELRVSAFVESRTEMVITEAGGTYLAEARCMHAPGCDGEPVLAWSSGPAVFAFDGASIQVLQDPIEEKLYASGGYQP